MIFPSHCKYVGYASSKPVGDLVYFLSRYLIQETDEGYEVLEVEVDSEADGIMRRVKGVRVLAGSDDICMYGERLNLHNRADLIMRANSTGKRCTVFSGADEHLTFVLDPDIEEILHIHVYDIMPPRPNLTETLKSLERTGLFGELQVVFDHHVNDIRNLDADIFPCQASGFERTLDHDRPGEGERVAGCMTARQILTGCYGDNYPVIDICPANAVDAEPFIARCCRSERSGVGTTNGKFGAVVHWGASPRQIADAVFEVVKQWRGN